MSVEAGGRLVGPPRAVPWSVRAQVLAGRMVVVGALVFGIAGAPAVVLLAAADPVGIWRLAGGVSQAPGRLVAVDELNYRENGRPLVRFRYTYRTPGGVERSGVCYGWRDSVKPPPPGADRDPKLRPVVAVGYAPGHPETSRIRVEGMRPGAANPIFGLFFAVAALVGVVILLVGVRQGLRVVSLLGVGELGRATVVSCRFASQGNSETPPPELSIAQVRQDWLDRAVDRPSEAVRTVNPVQSLAVWFMRFWTCSTVVLVGFGTVFLIAMVSLEPLRQRGLLPFRMQPAPPGWNLFAWGILAAWLIIGPFLIWSGFRGLAVASGKKTAAQLQPNPRLRCEFELTLPDGRVVRARDTATFSARLGDAPTEPVLYDPDRPDRALLLNGLNPAVEVSEFGEWVGTVGLRPWLRLSAVMALVVGGPALGWWAWQSL